MQLRGSGESSLILSKWAGELQRGGQPAAIHLDFPSKTVVIVDVACGRGHTLVRDDQGRCFSWGACLQGQLGTEFSYEDEADSYNSAQPEFISQPLQIPKLRWATQIACGFDSSAVVAADGQLPGALYTFGCNRSGQLGLGLSCSKYSTPEEVNNKRIDGLGWGDCLPELCKWPKTFDPLRAAIQLEHKQ